MCGKAWNLQAGTMRYVVIFATIFALSDALAVMSVDLGSEFMKIAIVKPGVPMEVALNYESRRKTPVMVSMRNGERLFSDPALATSVKYPHTAYLYLQDLLAKDLENPIVKQFQERFPYHDLVEVPDKNSIAFKHDEETFYTPEELLAMVLEHAKDIAEHFAEQTINEAVLTVPPYFNQAERRAVLRAGELAGLKVLQLMNDNTAVALNYGVFRRKSFNATVQHYMFFDMGSNSASATIVAYQEVKEKSKATGIVDKFPQVTVKGVGFDRNLGGLEINLRLRDHLAKLFNEQKKTTNDVTQNKRSMAKLYKEAARVKQVLSANAFHYAQVESLLDDQDFKAKVTRDELELMCKDIFDRIDVIVAEALKSSEVTMHEIDEVILMGGSTRIPKVQEHLQKAVGREELGKSINTDEAAALGAVYQAAHLGKGFKVKKFGVKEATLFPIQVDFERVRKNEDGVEETKMIKRTLFGRNNPYPQKKVMTFNKHTDDFNFFVNYGELEFLTEDFLKGFGKTTLQEISLEGVGKAYDSHANEAHTKGVKAHFKMDESGILVIDMAEFVFEKTEDAAGVDSGADEQSTLSKLGNTISNLFGGGEHPEDKESTVEESANEDEAKNDSTDNQEKSEDKTEESNDDMKMKKEQNGSDKSTDEEMDQSEDASEEIDDLKQETDSLNDEGDDTAQDNDATQEKSDDSKTSEKKKDTEEVTAEDDSQTEPSDSTQDGEKTEDTDGQKSEEREEKIEKGDENKTEDATDKTDKSKKKEEKPKSVTVKEELKAKVSVKDREDPAKETLKNTKKMLKELKKKDEEKKKLEHAMNDLESFIIDAQDKLYQEDYETCSNEEERDSVRSAFTQASDWMYEYDGEPIAKPYQDKLKDLQKLTTDLWDRVKERQERPRAIDALNQMLNYSTFFLVGMQNFTGEEKGEQPFTTVEYTTLQDLIKETFGWNKTISEEQAATPATEKPKMTVHDIAVKIQALDREIKYLTNKIKTFKPKPKPKEPTDTNKTESAKKDKKTASESAEDKETPKDKETTEDVEGEKLKEQPVEGDDTKREEPVEGEDAEEPLQLEEASDSDSTTQSAETSENKQTVTEQTEETGTHVPGEL